MTGAGTARAGRGALVTLGIVALWGLVGALAAAGAGAAGWLRSLPRQRENELDELSGRAIQAFLAGDFQTASEADRRLLELDPTTVTARVRLA